METTTTYDRLVACIHARNAQSTTTANGRRMIRRHQRGMLSAWEATCGLVPLHEQIPTIEEFRYLHRGANMMIG